MRRIFRALRSVAGFGPFELLEKEQRVASASSDIYNLVVQPLAELLQPKEVRN